MSGSEFTVDGIAYRPKRLSAARQYEILRRVTPVMGTLLGADLGMRLGGLDAAALMVLLAPLRNAPDEVTDAVFADARSAFDRADGEPVADLSLSALMMLTAEMARVNFGPMQAMDRPRFDPCPLGENDRGFGDFGPVEMPDGVDWLYAPMVAGYCRYGELHDGSLRIEDVARMNDILAVKAENEARLHRAAEQT